jgi:DNA-binding transcriptional LysR family regulator
MEAARHAHEGECGSIKIGIPSRLGGVLSAAVAEHCKRFPALDVQRKDICSSLQNEALRSGEIDIGFFRPPIDHAHLDCELLFEEEFVVVLPATHRLAKRRFLRAKALRAKLRSFSTVVSPVGFTTKYSVCTAGRA